MAHPIGHEDQNAIAQRRTQRGKRNSHVAVRGFRSRISRLNLCFFVSLAKNAERQPVFDAAGHVQLFGLGVNAVLAPVTAKMYAQSKERYQSAAAAHGIFVPDNPWFATLVLICPPAPYAGALEPQHALEPLHPIQTAFGTGQIALSDLPLRS